MTTFFILSVVFPALALLLRAKDDKEIIERLQRRDPDAMGELYDRYGRLVYSLIYKVVRNEGVAEDLVQESFLRIWNRIGAFDKEKGALGPWILTVARNRAIDYIRSVDGRLRQSTIEMERIESPAVFSDLVGQLEAVDRMKALKAAFESLNPNQRMVIELAYFEGLSQTEMADRLKQPLGTVKTWVRSALLKLRQEIGQEVSVV